ncbi:MAG: PP2C family protein-serine/threonine phosphatase, partial [Bacteriovoracaceae bacterium]
EMKEKTRLENELKTAQLVQESFFPQDLIESPSLKLKAFYRPAAECGGDWWGYVEKQNIEALIMIDVTGHGTAAALVTAVIHNSLTALKFIADKDPEFLKSPAKIMDFLNESLCSVDVNLYASAFVMAVDNQTNQAFYSNASHNPPYQIPAKNELKKSDFIPLMKELGPRLGESRKSSYGQTRLEADKGEKIILFTDGLIECENRERKAYGTRRFVKKIIEVFSEDPAIMTHEIVKDVFAFSEGVEPKDDITLICLEVK